MSTDLRIPSSYYAAVNIPAALIYGLGLPAAICICAGLAWWWTALVSVSWHIANYRIIDRYLPVLTHPVVVLVYRLLGRRSQNNDERA